MTIRAFVICPDANPKSSSHTQQSPSYKHRASNSISFNSTVSETQPVGKMDDDESDQ